MDIPRRQSPWRFLLTVVAVAVVWYLFIRPGTDGLDAEAEAELLQLAREQLVATASGDADLIDVTESDLPPRLLLPGSAFITLSRDGELRGCMIDTFEEHEPLYRNVLRNTILAARDDGRFRPVSPEEVGELRISVSVVTPPEPLAFDDPEDLLSRLDPGLDGVILTTDGAMAAYLPDVWERFPDPEEFLEHLCEKADLPADRWRQAPYPSIETFRIVKFEEG
jgi:AmmeMemoRadiSam system protein A